MKPARLLKARPSANLETMQKRSMVPVNVHRQSNKTLNPQHFGQAKDKSAWEQMSLKGQEEYLRRHPHSKRRITNTEHQHITPKDPAPHERPKARIIWPERSTTQVENKPELTEAERQARREGWKKQFANRPGYRHKQIDFSKQHSFLNRLTQLAPKVNGASGQKEFAEFMAKYDKLTPDDFEDEADRYYANNPEHALEDGVDSHSDLLTTEPPMSLDDDAQAKTAAENNKKPQNPTILENVNKQYKANPFGKLPVAEQKKQIRSATKVLAKGFSADSNNIIAHAYQNLGAEQINTLDDMAHDAASRHKAAKLPAKRKKFLKTIGVAIMVSAAMVFGGPTLAALAFHHSLALANPDGNLHKVIWNSLRGKLADGSDDPDFDPHEDAVEKIVKSLKRQLSTVDPDDHDSQEHIQAIIDQLEASTEHHQLHKDDIIHVPSHTRRRGARKPTKSKSKRH